MPKLTHPDTKRSIQVRDDQMETYASQGWILAPAPKPRPGRKRIPKK